MENHEQDIKINSLELNQKSMAEKIDDLKKTVINGFDEIRESFKCLDNKYVSQEAFWPVKTVVYGLVGIILLTIAGGMVALLLK